MTGSEKRLPASDLQAPGASAAGGFARWLPLAGLALLMGLVFAMGWHRYLTFKTIGLNYDLLKGIVADNLVAAIALYMLVYVTVIALSLPGGLVMTLAGGLVFGWRLAVPATVVAATIGATIIFLIAKSSFGAVLQAKAGPWLGKLQDGFKENALSYLLFLRLVPVFPFAVVNLAPALLGVPLGTYVIGTAVGIIPGTAAFSVAGSGLGSVVEAQNAVYRDCLARNPDHAEDQCPYTIDTSALVTTELLIAFALLGVVALIPAAYKTWNKRHAAD
ncbi:MAG TPA: VTT domain-containing protein [Hyphomicrobiaceae bacterium]|nr:VTT domain-containing protein [Hyphomicrobiaceae bacterium]